MDITFFILASLVIFLSHRRSRATSAEISEALGSRDRLIESLRSEIKDRFDQIVQRAEDAIDAAKANRRIARGDEATAEPMDDVFRGTTLEHLELLEDVLQFTKILDQRAKLQREQCTANRASIDALDVDKRTLGYFEALDALNKKMERAEIQIGTNKRLIAELGQQAARPPLGESPTLAPHSITTKPHCYDGPQD